MAVVAGTVARPDSVAEAADLLRDTRGTLLFRGGGTKMAWAGRPDQPDLLVETTGLNRLLEHNPADMTAVVEAGMPLSTLQDVLGESGQWLALDPATQIHGATIGGLLATGESGPRRLDTARCATSSSASRSCWPTAPWPMRAGASSRTSPATTSPS